MSRKAFALSALLALSTSLLATAPATAAGRPDLVVASVSGAPATLQPGWGFIATAKVTNKGRAASKGSAVRFYMSTDATKSSNDTALGSASLKSIKPRKSRSTSAAVAVPDDTAVGTYNLVACADDPSKNRESSEKNNCKAAGSTFEVVAPGPAPNPQNVTTTLDPTGAVTETIGKAGGALTTEGPDGTTYELSIPQNAIVGDAKITMTPVTAVSGLPLTSLGGAVQITPEGLQLLKPATLTIGPATSIPVANQRGFGAEGTGEDFYLDYLAMDTDTIALKLTHFSTHGVGNQSGSSTTTRVPSDSEARARERMSESIADARERGELDAQALSELETTLREWFHESVASQLANATTNAATDAAIAEALSWWRNVELLGLEDALGRELGQMKALLEQLIQKAIDRALNKCVTEKNPEEALNIIKYGRMQELLGFGDGSVGAASIQKVLDCLRFEVKFDSTQRWVNDGFTWSGRVRATIDLQSTGSPNQMLGISDTPVFNLIELAYVDQCAPVSGHSYTAIPLSAPESFFGIQFNRDGTQEPHLSLYFPAPLIQETYQIHTEDDDACVASTVPGAAHFTVNFGTMHEDELYVPLGSYVITDWEILGAGGVYAQKVYERSLPGPGGEGTMTESTKFELIHKPRS